jgi:mRNA-degrading endonuclease toxin of MazEF toxin-antitoxin module
VPSLVRGRVVYSKVPIPDPQGQNPKEGRPFVVVSRDDDIKQGQSIQAVGITSELQSSPLDHYVLLPYGPNAKTGLRQKSAALCTWLIDISPENVSVGKGYVRPDLVEQIVTRVLQLKSVVDSSNAQSGEESRPDHSSDRAT